MHHAKLAKIATHPTDNLPEIEVSLVKSYKAAAKAVASVSRAQARYDEALLGGSLHEALAAREALARAEVERDRLAAIIRLLQRRYALASAAIAGRTLSIA